MTNELENAINDAHKVFSRYPMPNYLGLRGNFQLRDLTIESWNQFNAEHDMGVLMFSDNGEMLRYFLPRWLQWLSDDKTLFGTHEWNFWGLGNRLTMLGWQHWPMLEVNALRRVFEIWSREEIVSHGGMPKLEQKTPTSAVPPNSGENMGLEGFQVRSWIFEFLSDARVTEIYLEIWLDTNLPQLARWVWTENWHQYKLERNWIASSRLESELETAFFADADGPNAELFSRSIELVRSLRA